jgi:hypothetical protein
MARRHGTRSCYTLGCRREECVKANATYERERLRSKRPPREKIDIRQISDLDLAWLAGLLEGEGAFILHQEPAIGARRARVIIRVAVHMTDRDVVERVRDIVGLGSVHRRPPGKPHHKETFRWAISASSDPEIDATCTPSHGREARRPD